MRFRISTHSYEVRSDAQSNEGRGHFGGGGGNGRGGGGGGGIGSEEEKANQDEGSRGDDDGDRMASSSLGSTVVVTVTQRPLGPIAPGITTDVVVSLLAVGIGPFDSAVLIEGLHLPAPASPVTICPTLTAAAETATTATMILMLQSLRL